MPKQVVLGMGKVDGRATERGAASPTSAPVQVPQKAAKLLRRNLGLRPATGRGVVEEAERAQQPQSLLRRLLTLRVLCLGQRNRALLHTELAVRQVAAGRALEPRRKKQRSQEKRQEKRLRT
mmetsp:Transcript_19866/g.34763  ORF Transcript_19866/g.34763 Transcript_19866/m.34763 type:complete len:122 (-) Transcript_19866:45-410(-)